MQGLVAYAVARGASREALIARSGIDLRDVEHHDRRVPLSRYLALLHAGETLCDDPALALHFGESVGAMELSVVCLLGSTCETMADAFAYMNRYARLTIDVDSVNGGDHFQLQHTPDGVWVIDARRYPGVFPQLTESSFTRMVVGTRQLTDWQFVRAVHFTRAAPSYAAEYRRIFRAPVAFERARNAMLLDPAWFALRIEVTPRYVNGLLTAHADALLDELEHGRSCRWRVEAALRPRLTSGAVGMEHTARTLGMSRQTLYRRLKAEGVTYEQVLDALRRQVALQVLGGEKMSVAEAASRAGFSDAAAFSRAFKRWTGRSPRAVARPA